MTVLERADDDTRSLQARWHCLIDHAAATAYVELLGVDAPRVAAEVDAYTGRGLGSHLLALTSSRIVPGERRPAGLLPAAALAERLAHDWRAHWAQVGESADPDEHPQLLGAFVQRLGDVIARTREPVRRRGSGWPAARAETVTRGVAARWCAQHQGLPEDPALLAEEAGEFATHQELVVAGARRKLRSLSKEHAELLDQLLVIAAGRDDRSPVPAAVHTAYVTVRLTRRGDEGLFSDLPETLGMPYVTGPEHVAHLCRVTDIDRHLDDLDWLRASAAAYVRWGDARVRQALDDGRLVEAACRAARWSGRDRLTYSLLRLTQKGERAGYYGIHLDDPWLGRVLAGRAKELAVNLRACAQRVDEVTRGDDAQTRWLAGVLQREYASSEDRHEAVSAAFIRIIEILRAGPLPGETDEQTARTTPPGSAAEYVFQSDFELWCKSVRASKRSDPGTDVWEPEPEEGDGIEPVEIDPVLERMANEALALLDAPYDLHCSAADPSTCDGTCLRTVLERASESELRHRIDAIVSDTDGAPAVLADELARWREQRARVLALGRRWSSAGCPSSSSTSTASRRTGRTPWAGSPSGRPRRARAHGHIFAWSTPRTTGCGTPTSSPSPTRRSAGSRGAPSEANVRQARLNFLKALERHDAELAIVYRWLRVDAAKADLKWLDGHV